MNFRKLAEQIFLAGVESVVPEKLIHDRLSLSGSSIVIDGKEYPLNKDSNIYVIGAGKASAEMALAVEGILGNRIAGGHVIVKYGYSCILEYIGLTEAGHPVPDENGFAGTHRILEIARNASQKDVVLCLISGGGSALLADFPDGSSPAEIALLNDLLVKTGATINEINTVRKHFSMVKGGGLVHEIFPAYAISLILSDVPGDPLDVIASGPTVPDTSTFTEAIGIIQKFGIAESIPLFLKNHLLKGAAGAIPETPKPGDPVFKRSDNIVIGNNRIALKAAAEKALNLGLRSEIVDYDLHGNSCKAAEYIVEKAVALRNPERKGKPLCLLFGGETTLKVTGKSPGGRNQHLALQAAVLLRDIPGITLLSAGTDGNDGPTNVAGAVVDSDTFKAAIQNKLDPYRYLDEFDSYDFFRISGGHIITGPTRTNVMDMMVVIIEHMK